MAPSPAVATDRLAAANLQFFFRTSQAFPAILDGAARVKLGIRVLKAKACGCDFKRIALWIVV
jgi:hypothetical protein